MRTEIIKYGAVTLYLLHYRPQDFWVEENYPLLFPTEKKHLNSIHHPLKQKEFVAVRWLRSQFLPKEEIFYSEIGAPYIHGGGFISISHARNVVGLAYCKDFLVGLDLEPIGEKAKRVQKKFLSENEKKNLFLDSALEMTKVWSGKEALYKLAGRKKIIFAEHLLLEKINEEKRMGELNFPGMQKKVEMNISEKENFIISINVNPIYEINKRNLSTI